MTFSIRIDSLDLHLPIARHTGQEIPQEALVLCCGFARGHHGRPMIDSVGSSFTGRMEQRQTPLVDLVDQPTM